MDNDARAATYGYDRAGLECSCYWKSALHGDVCPEHGTPGRGLARAAGLRARAGELAWALESLLEAACSQGHWEAVLFSHSQDDGHDCPACARARRALEAMARARKVLEEKGG